MGDLESFLFGSKPKSKLAKKEKKKPKVDNHFMDYCFCAFSGNTQIISTKMKTFWK